MSVLTAPRSRASLVPWLFVAGFAIVIAVNGTMTWLAIESFSGLYSNKPRDRGLRYNQVVAEQRERDALGWKVETSWQAGTGTLGLTVADRDGTALQDAAVTVELIRPAEKRASLRIAMTPVDGGRFAGAVDLPARGNWDADIVILSGGRRFAVTRRVFLP
jgi:nitrogen fixation protein FixH